MASIWLISNAPDSMLIQIAEFNPYVLPRLPRPEVRRFDFHTGKSQIEEKNPGNVVEWLADHHGSGRAAVALDEDKYRIRYRTTRGDRWRVVHESAVTDITAALRQRTVALPKAYRFGLREQVGDYREEKEDLKKRPGSLRGA